MLQLRTCYTGDIRHIVSRAFTTHQTTRAELYDVVIVGGGPAGCALAGTLGSLPALADKRIALIDPARLGNVQKWEPPTDTYLSRTLQITASNKRFLDSLGLWSRCHTDRVQECNRAVVTDALGGGMVDLAAVRSASAAAEATSVAHMIETKNLVSGLLRSLNQSCPGVDIIERVRVVGIDTDPAAAGARAEQWPVVTLSDERRLQTRLLIGADGASSCVRRYAGIGTYGTDYAQHSLVATLCLEHINHTAFQRFLPTGPIALLPFPGGFANLIWSLDSELLMLLKTAPDRVFSDLVNAAFRLSCAEMRRLYDMLRQGTREDALRAEIEWRLASFSQSNAGSDAQLPPRIAAISPRSRTSFPLRMRIVDSLVGGRVALVGDAGHVVHPLAGQGLNMGLEDIQCLSRVLELATIAGEDIGASAVLARYNRHRYARNLAMQGVVDKIWHAFGARSGLVSAARSLAMNGLDRLPAAKSRLVSAIMT
ncbi:putative ubiquinone biosynthesis monooxygenase [Coemansia guatemalensis]|uniref:Ubiquinone biosynthesis monooxygenase COQ6, mitochondrial n=1 Tax=Coemansia guatemalensis TaxID=2761395 RepID=A0A9W8I6M3_9FUNG|nr:putative ubiquinone biosynthesis monooxygenase [Coemansia guatemalensis]